MKARNSFADSLILLIAIAHVAAVSRPDVTKFTAFNPLRTRSCLSIFITRTVFTLIMNHFSILTAVRHINRFKPYECWIAWITSIGSKMRNLQGTLSFSHGADDKAWKPTSNNPRITINFIVWFNRGFIESINFYDLEKVHKMYGNWLRANCVDLCISSHFLGD